MIVWTINPTLPTTNLAFYGNGPTGHQNPLMFCIAYINRVKVCFQIRRLEGVHLGAGVGWGCWL